MKLTARIIVTSTDIETLHRCIGVDIPAMQTKRSTVTIEKTKSTLTFDVTAKDPVALRATLHGITKLLEVYQKAT